MFQITLYHHGKNAFAFGVELTTLFLSVTFYPLAVACVFWLLTRASGYVCSYGFDKTLNLDNTSSRTFLPVRFKCDTKQPVLDQ